MKFTPQQAIQFMTNISEKILDNFEQKPKMMIAIHRSGRNFQKQFPEIQKQPSEVFCKKKVFFEISQNFLENTCARASFFNKVAGLLGLFLLFSV